MKRKEEKIVALNSYIHETSSSGYEVVRNAFMAGYETAYEALLDKSCRWLGNRHNIEKCLGVSTSKTEDLSKSFRQAMKGGAE